MPTPEGELKKAVSDFLKVSGVHHLRLNSGIIKSGSRFIHLCPEGTPDYVIFCPDPRWLEIKAPGQRTKKERVQKQAEFADKVKSLGHRHLQATRLDEVIQFVQ